MRLGRRPSSDKRGIGKASLKDRSRDTAGLLLRPWVVEKGRRLKASKIFRRSCGRDGNHQSSPQKGTLLLNALGVGIGGAVLRSGCVDAQQKDPR